MNTLNMLHTLRFSSSKCRLFHKATFFVSCIIHILNTGVLTFKRKFRRLKVNRPSHTHSLPNSAVLVFLIIPDFHMSS